MAEQVLAGLKLANSQHEVEAKEATKMLDEWQIMPGFYRALAEIFSNPEIDENIRFMSLVWLKIGIDRYWRPIQPK